MNAFLYICAGCVTSCVLQTESPPHERCNLPLTFTLWSRSHRSPVRLRFLGGRLFSLLHVPQQRAGVYQSPGSVSWELSRDKSRTPRVTRREQNNCFYKGQNRKTSCGPLPCVVIDLTVVILGVSHLIDVSLSAHCNGKHFMLSASRPDLYSILWQLLPLSSNTFGMLRNRQLLLKCSDYKQAFYPFRLSPVCAVFGKGLLPQQDNVVDTEKDTVAVFGCLFDSVWASE